MIICFRCKKEVSIVGSHWIAGYPDGFCDKCAKIIMETKMKVYKVGIDKVYFPIEKRPRFVLLYEPPVKVKANSRTEAAKLVWESHGKGWLQEMGPSMTGATKRKVSLHVNEPSAGVGGIIGRLSSIRVYEEKVSP